MNRWIRSRNSPIGTDGVDAARSRAAAEGADKLRLRGTGGGRRVTAGFGLNERGEEAEGLRNPTLVVPQDGIVAGVGSRSGGGDGDGGSHARGIVFLGLGV